MSSFAASDSVGRMSAIFWESCWTEVVCLARAIKYCTVVSSDMPTSEMSESLIQLVVINQN